jgi:hypothetical protein
MLGAAGLPVSGPGRDWGVDRGMSPTGPVGRRPYSGRMDEARPLRDVFAELAGDGAADSAGILEAAGHPDLPGSLVNEAIVNFADTAPAEVAEHLAPFVMAHGPVPVEDLPAGEMDAAHGLELLSTAPAYGPALDEPAFDAPAEHDAADHGQLDVHADDPFDLDFGHGEVAHADETVHIGQDVVEEQSDALHEPGVVHAEHGADLPVDVFGHVLGPELPVDELDEHHVEHGDPGGSDTETHVDHDSDFGH